MRALGGVPVRDPVPRGADVAAIATSAAQASCCLGDRRARRRCAGAGSSSRRTRSSAPLALGLGVRRARTMARAGRAPSRPATSGCSLARDPVPKRRRMSLSQTKAPGTPPRRVTQPTRPLRRSAVVRERVNVIACAAEKGSVVTRPNASGCGRAPPGPGRRYATGRPGRSRPGRMSCAGTSGRRGRRAHPGEVLLQDWCPALVSVGAQALPDHRGPDRRVVAQHRRDPVGEGMELGARRGRRYAAARTGRGAGRRCAAHAERPGDGGLGPSLAMEEPMDLGAVLHLMHSFLPRDEILLKRGCRPTWSGVLELDRREVLSIRAASECARALRSSPE